MELHLKFREMRLNKGWTQRYVAEKIFVSEKTISSWEQGHRQMDASTIQTLSELFQYELQPADKKALKRLTLKDILNSSCTSLSMSTLLNEHLVTIKADVPQRLLNVVKEASKKQGITIDELIEEALNHYIEALKISSDEKGEDNAMKIYKKVNGWVIKEKRLDEVPNFIEDDRRYAIFSPTGIWMEDHLTLEEAVEWANENNDYAK